MRTIILLISCTLLLTLTGCKSKQSATKETLKLDAVENIDLTLKETERKSDYENVVKDIKTNTTDKSVTRKTETEYSEPDADGNQHKTKETTTETLNDIAVTNEQNERIIREQSVEIERLTVDNSELRTKLNYALNEQTKTATRPPIWTYIVVFSVGVVLALIIRSWVKRRFKV